ncbi:MAG TPA: hypothetical protein VI365_31605 [Trebonia sp.]
MVCSVFADTQSFHRPLLRALWSPDQLWSRSPAFCASTFVESMWKGSRYPRSVRDLSGCSKIVVPLWYLRTCLSEKHEDHHVLKVGDGAGRGLRTGCVRNLRCASARADGSGPGDHAARLQKAASAHAVRRRVLVDVHGVPVLS